MGKRSGFFSEEGDSLAFVVNLSFGRRRAPARIYAPSRKLGHRVPKRTAATDKSPPLVAGLGDATRRDIISNAKRSDSGELATTCGEIPWKDARALVDLVGGK